MDDQELERAVAEFTGAFEVLFGQDWPYSLATLQHHAKYVIRPEATFIEPGVDLDNSDWGSRAALLRSYRALLSVMASRGMRPALPVRDAYFVYKWPQDQ